VNLRHAGPDLLRAIERLADPSYADANEVLAALPALRPGGAL
jgi:hypothetical protein